MQKLFFLEELEELFTDVQVSRIFADQKAFADCIPKAETSVILQEYQKQKQENTFNLAAFVAEYFEVPPYNEVFFVSDTSVAPEFHVAKLWDILTTTFNTSIGTSIGLPYPYVVPGGRFRELFYWDSYFTMLGLQVSGKTNLVENMINDFAWLIDNYNIIPNGTKSYFLSRSQPPFFSLMIAMLSEEKGEAVYITYLPQLTAEYNFWMKGSELLTNENNANGRVVLLPDGTILNRYWDEKDTPRPEGYIEDIAVAENATEKNATYRHIRAACESGWDFSGRWCSDGKEMATIATTDIVPVDLNCLLLHLEKTLHHTHTLLNNTTEAAFYFNKAEQRKVSIQKYLWSNEQNTFCDYWYPKNQPSTYLSAAMLFPLFINIATEAQANAVLKLTEEKFLQQGGLLTSLYVTGQQWDAPNGWAPLQWIGYKAALNYNNHQLAEKIKQYWVANVERVYKATGKMMEKYNVIDVDQPAGKGEYPNQDGFGWTNGVYLKFLKS